MSRSAPIDESRTEGSTARIGLRLAAGAALCLATAGALLWWQQGGGVFAAFVSGALAWCM